MSSKRKTKYEKSWETEFAWIQSFKTDVCSGLCRVCSKVFSISGGRIVEVNIHKSSKLHISGENEREGQCMFKKDRDNTLGLKGTQTSLAKEDLIRKAEIIRALKFVKSNYSFLSTSDDNKIFKEIGFQTRKLLRNPNKVRPKQNAPFNMGYISTQNVYY